VYGIMSILQVCPDCRPQEKRLKISRSKCIVFWESYKSVQTVDHMRNA